MMHQSTRVTASFNSATPTVDVNLAGFQRINFPCGFLSVNLLHLNIPFAFVDPDPESGFILINLEGETPHVLFANDGLRYNYTWCVPFEPSAQEGNFAWFTQAAHAGDDRYSVSKRFRPDLRFEMRFISSATRLPLAFPPTPSSGAACSLEISIAGADNRTRV